MKRLLSAVFIDAGFTVENLEVFEAKFQQFEDAVLDRIRVRFPNATTQSPAARTAREYSSGNPINLYPGYWTQIAEAAAERVLACEEAAWVQEQVISVYTDMSQPYDDVEAFLTRASTEGMPVAMIANGDAGRLRAFLDRTGIREQLTAFVPSGAFPFSKPNLGLFEIARAALGKPASETVMIGDRTDTDVHGANNAGSWSVRVARRSAPPHAVNDGSEEEADFVVANLCDVLDLPIFKLTKELDTVVVVCGGQGTRMGQLATNRQKCLLEVGGRPIIEHVLDRFASAGISTAILLANYRANQVAALYRDHPRDDISVIVRETHEASTGDVIASQLPSLPDQFIYSHGNVIIPAHWVSQLLKAAYKHPTSTPWLATEKPTAATHPSFHRKGDAWLITRFHLDGVIDQYYSIGVGVIRKPTFEPPKPGTTTEECLRPEFVKPIVQDGEWFHFEQPSDIDAYDRTTSRRRYGRTETSVLH